MTALIPCWLNDSLMPNSTVFALSDDDDLAVEVGTFLHKRVDGLVVFSAAKLIAPPTP